MKTDVLDVLNFATSVGLLSLIRKKVNAMSGKTALAMDPAEWRQYRPFRAGDKALPLARSEEARRVASCLARFRQAFFSHLME